MPLTLDVQIVTRIVAIVIAGIFLRSLVVAIYRWKFHPLSRFPGPWLAKVTDGYVAYHSALGDSHVWIHLAHQEYGPIVRIGPNKLVTADLKAFQDLYTSKSVQKSQGYLTMSRDSGSTHIQNCVDKAIHRHKRKIIAQAFTDKHLAAFEPTMINHINIFVDIINKRIEEGHLNGCWSSPIKVSDYGRNLAMDIMGSLGFGSSLDLQTSPKNRFIVGAVNAATFMSGIYVQYPKLQQYIIGDFMRFAGQWTREKFARLAKDLVDSRLSEAKEAKSDLFAFLIDAKDPDTGESFSLEDLWSESRLFIVAGSDTEVCAISATLFYLSRYPECYNKLASIIRFTFQSSDEIHSGDKLNSCHYLRACIDESLRDTIIPIGTDIGSSLYAIHHNEEAFPNSFKFEPERWIPSPDNPPDKITAQRKAFHPFSFGSRQCIAPPLAYLELTITLAKTVWHFDIRRTAGPLDKVGAGSAGGPEGRRREREYQMTEHITCKADGPYLEFSQSGMAPA